LNARNNKAMAHTNLMNVYQEKIQDIQDIQDFMDQYMTMAKVCDELDLKFGRCKSYTRAVLKEMVVTDPTNAELGPIQG